MNAPLDPRDLLILEHAPLAVAPRYGALPPIPGNSHRYIVTAYDVVLEVRRPWLHCGVSMLDDAAEFRAALPYGDVGLGTRFAFDWNQQAFPLIERFIEAAEGCIVEHEAAAWIVWDERKRALEYVELEVMSSSPAHIEYRTPRLEPHQTLAIDLHSHGMIGPFFSSHDNDDDAGATKIAGVIGRGEHGELAWKFRLCVLGVFIDLDVSDYARCHVCGCTNGHACRGGCSWVRPNFCSACA